MAEISFEPPELVLARAWKAANEERRRQGLSTVTFERFLELAREAAGE